MRNVKAKVTEPARSERNPGHDAAAIEQVLAGPILRRLEARRIVFWLATRNPCALRLSLDFTDADGVAHTPVIDLVNGTSQHEIRVGEQCIIQLIDIELDTALPTDTRIAYDFLWRMSGGDDWHSTAAEDPELCMPGQTRPAFVLRSRLDRILHGSCRKPHHPAGDGLVAAEAWLQQRFNEPARWPSALMMSGDQIYADDVAGPMLTAIHQLVETLGLYPETIHDALVADSQELYASDYNYYRRHTLLPDVKSNEPLRKRFFEGTRKPVFTTSNADNHLVTLAEVMAMYLLVWSPETWKPLAHGAPAHLTPEETARYAREREALAQFVQGLPAVRRLLAHLPTLMIFDDHDITDDWNLTADWEQTAYGHAFSRRIIGNALIGYLICQGWGNNPDAFDGQTLKLLRKWSAEPGTVQQDTLIDHVLHLHRWDYSLPTTPKLLVLDTRTRRWRSENNLRHPSGLMDWEALSELQNELLHHDAVVMVSPAPVFGVKLIEAIQKIFTWIGKPLLVDAENWMAHRGTAYAILNIFTHTKTPAHFVILSGDVHYSFVYGVTLRSASGEPHLWQITSSGIKNEFPRKLLDTLDRLSRWLYSPRSPLNWFTRRRRMKISPFKPENASKGERLLNQAGVGYVKFDTEGRPVKVMQISADRLTAFRLDE
ncbi:MAG: alkaline phosphatase family protein [Pusillimonas sp.]